MAAFNEFSPVDEPTDARTNTIGVRINDDELKVVSKLTKILADCGQITPRNKSDAARWAILFTHAVINLAITQRAAGQPVETLNIKMDWLKLVR